jgi:predicted nuclease of restriction endonuclease-like (RecB) superfamily
MAKKVYELYIDSWFIGMFSSKKKADKAKNAYYKKHYRGTIRETNIARDPQTYENVQLNELLLNKINCRYD